MFYNQSTGQPITVKFLCKAGSCCCRTEEQKHKTSGAHSAMCRAGLGPAEPGRPYAFCTTLQDLKSAA